VDECIPDRAAALGQAAPVLKDDQALTRLAAPLRQGLGERVDVSGLKLALDGATLTGRPRRDFARPRPLRLAAGHLDLDRTCRPEAPR
jgi:hypothetical protein